MLHVFAALLQNVILWPLRENCLLHWPVNWGITCQSPSWKTLFLYTCHTEIKAHTSILSLMCLRASAVPWKSSSSGMVTKSNFSFGLQRLVKIWWNCVSAESSTIIMISGKKINTRTCYCCWSYEQPNLNEGPRNVEGHSLAARPIRSTTQIFHFFFPRQSHWCKNWQYFSVSPVTHLPVVASQYRPYPSWVPMTIYACWKFYT